MATKNDSDVDYSALGLTEPREDDRVKIGETKESLMPLKITHVRFDEKTRYYDSVEKTGTPIVKINGINENGETVKLFSLSDVLFRNMKDLKTVIGGKMIVDENKVEWFLFDRRITVKGFELIKTEKGKNPYVKIIN